MAVLLYDLTALQSQSTAPVHGGGKFAEIVFYRLIERNIPFSVFYDSNRNIKKEILEAVTRNTIACYDIKDKSIGEVVSTLDNPTIFSILPQKEYFICKTIGTIHDCRESCLPVDFKRFFLKYDFQDVKEYVLQRLIPNILKKRRARRLSSFVNNPNFIPTTITYFTKYTLYGLFKNPSVLNIPIFMTPSYYQPYNDALSLKDGKFVLMVSANRWIKNPIRAIKAMDLLFENEELKDYKFVVVGINNEKELKLRIKNIENFIFKDYVSEEELLSLYMNCTCLLFPSLYEGFGMPPLEAMCFGKPVVASSLSAIPEVCREGALYINPYSIEDIKCKMSMILLDRVLYEEYKKNAIKRFGALYLEQEKHLDNYIDYVIKTINV